MLALCWAGVAPTEVGEATPRPTHELQCDVDRIRSWGWVEPRATEEDAWRALVSYADWRLDVAGIDVEVAHAPGTDVLTIEGGDGELQDAAMRLISGSLSYCELCIVAQDEDLAGGLEAERERFEAWRRSNPERPWLEYNSDPGREQRHVAWLPTRFAGKQGPPMALRLPRQASKEFSGIDFERVYRCPDSFGYPAVGFELKAERVDGFSAFTEESIGRRIAVVLSGEVRSAPILNAKLVGGGIIEGRFTDAEVTELIGVLRVGKSGELLRGVLLFLVGTMAKLTASVAVAAALAGLCVWLIRRRRRRAVHDTGDSSGDPGWPR